MVSSTSRVRALIYPATHYQLITTRLPTTRAALFEPSLFTTRLPAHQLPELHRVPLERVVLRVKRLYADRPAAWSKG
eukprot:scaffold60399_cov57-Phaeocystis_antarctica.AAC.2